MTRTFPISQYMHMGMFLPRIPLQFSYARILDKQHFISIWRTCTELDTPDYYWEKA